jgi:hypothetical protein
MPRLQDPVAMKGPTATFVGGARIVIDEQSFRAAGIDTDEEAARFSLKGSGMTPRANLVRSGTKLVPADYDSLAMASLYYNLERTRDYFENLGVASSLLTGLTTYYASEYEFRTAAGLTKLYDNAAYDSLLKALVFVPWKDVEEIPPALNLGIVAHEVGHRVLTERVFGGARFPYAACTSSRICNLYRALDEGLADLHGYGATCGLGPDGDTLPCVENFMVLSFPEAANRSVIAHQCITTGMVERLNVPLEAYTDVDKYALGTVIASALALSAEPGKATAHGRKALQESILAAYDDESQGRQSLRSFFEQATQTTAIPNPSLANVLDIFVSHAKTEALKAEMCGRFLDQMRLQLSDLPSCPSTAVATTNCGLGVVGGMEAAPGARP